jgi:hypothetical protein
MRFLICDFESPAQIYTLERLRALGYLTMYEWARKEAAMVGAWQWAQHPKENGGSQIFIARIA